MAYTTDIANLVAKQLSKLATLNRHQLAGQLANLEFWTSEVRHALAIIDGYEKRFQQMRRAQADYAREHQTIEYRVSPTGFRSEVAPVPMRIPKQEFANARADLSRSAYQFLLRCFREKLMDGDRVRKACDDLAIGYDPSDLRSHEANRAT